MREVSDAVSRLRELSSELEQLVGTSSCNRRPLLWEPGLAGFFMPSPRHAQRQTDAKPNKTRPQAKSNPRRPRGPSLSKARRRHRTAAATMAEPQNTPPRFPVAARRQGANRGQTAATAAKDNIVIGLPSVSNKALR